MTKVIERLPAVSARTGLSPSSVYKQIRLGLFPKGTKLTTRATGWDHDEVSKWIEVKLRGASDSEITEFVFNLEKERLLK